MQRFVKNGIRNCSAAATQFISPTAAFNRKPIASGADGPVGVCKVFLLKIILHGYCVIKKGTLKSFHVSVY